MKKEILQFKMTLLGSQPPIWRRVLVPHDVTFQELHNIFQEVMGWENYHLYLFAMKDLDILPPEADMSLGRENKTKSANEISLAEVIKKIGQKFIYIYDFTNKWEHEILFENQLPPEPGLVYPLCTAGELTCPPEECGGITAFYDLQPSNTAINLNQINHKLRQLEW